MTGQDIYNQFKAALLAQHVPAAQADAASKQAVAVATAESSLNTASSNENGENSYGLFQINVGLGATQSATVRTLMGQPVATIVEMKNWLMIPANNIKAAVAAWQNRAGSFRAWTTYIASDATIDPTSQYAAGQTRYRAALASFTPSSTASVASSVNASSTGIGILSKAAGEQAMANVFPAVTARNPVATFDASVAQASENAVATPDNPAWLTRVMYVFIGLVAAGLGLFILIKTLAVPAIGNITSALKGG